MMTNLFLVLIGVGFLGVVVVLINELIVKKKLRDKIADHEEIQQKSKTDTEKLKADYEALKANVQELLKTKEQLNQVLRQKDEMLQKYQVVGLNLIADRIDQTKLSDIMSSDVISIHVDSPFSDVARQMQKNDIRHLPIVDDDKKLVGMITQRMLYQIRSPRKLVDGEWYYDEEILNDVILKNVMEHEIVSLEPYQSVGKALMKMAFTKCGVIPIVDENNKLKGIVTRKDILKFAAGVYQNNKVAK